jgi:cyclopropane fatty-acyl-phospholipid synthase-like methyltransferase
MIKGLLRAAARRVSRFWTVSVAGRSEYGRVWDSVAQSRRDAMKAVAGHDSDADWEQTGRATADDIAAETGLLPSDTVLDIGCGAGRVGVHVAPRCRTWIGADVSKQMLAHTRQALAGVPNVELVQLAGDGLPASLDGRVDVVYCTTVFMHLEEWDRYRYVQAAYRVLKPGGRVYLDSFSLLSQDGWALFEAMAKLPPAERPPHISKASTPEELRTFVEKAGFEDIRVRGGRLYVTIVARKPAGLPR